MSAEPGHGVAGTYPAPARLSWFVWGAAALVYATLALINGLWQGNWVTAGLFGLLAVGSLVVLLLARAGRTVVSAEGLAIRVEVRSQMSLWDHVEAVVPPTAWDPQPTLTVLLAGGKEVLTEIPKSLHGALATYAREHRSPDDPGRATGGVPPGS